MSATLAPVFTIGYEGSDLRAFLATLRGAGIELVIDVRERTSSRKPGFSKGALEEALATEGIGYRHLRALGTPADLRRQHRAGLDWERFSARYAEHLAGAGEALDEVAAAARRARVALLCFEADARACHRSLISDELERRGAVTSTTHLRAADAAATNDNDP